MSTWKIKPIFCHTKLNLSYLNDHLVWQTFCHTKIFVLRGEGGIILLILIITPFKLSWLLFSRSKSRIFEPKWMNHHKFADINNSYNALHNMNKGNLVCHFSPLQQQSQFIGTTKKICYQLVFVRKRKESMKKRQSMRRARSHLNPSAYS